jgi:hypothetical protein
LSLGDAYVPAEIVQAFDDAETHARVKRTAVDLRF